MVGVIWKIKIWGSLPENYFYPVVHGTTNMRIFTSPAKILVVLQRLLNILFQDILETWPVYANYFYDRSELISIASVMTDGPM